MLGRNAVLVAKQSSKLRAPRFAAAVTAMRAPNAAAESCAAPFFVCWQSRASSTAASSSSSPPSSSATQAGSLSEAAFHDIAEGTLEELVDLLGKVESELDDADITLSQGVLTLTLGDKFGGKSWVINKQTPNRQIWWSSPLSGPRRYELLQQGNGKQPSAQDWRFSRDANQDLLSNLKEEILRVTGVNL